MEWTECIRGAIDYMEAHIREGVTPRDAARAVNVSPLYLQRGFEIVSGVSMSRYLRYRRLYLAALDLVMGKERVLDVALRYGFETPESFTKAFTRFHGATPSQVMQDHRLIKTYFPLKITLTVQGGDAVEYTVERMESFQVVGFQREISFDEGYRECPRFWEEYNEAYGYPLFAGKPPETELEKAVCRYGVGELGVCLDDLGHTGKFRYLIAGRYEGGPLPKGMTVFRFPSLEWAKFPCRGPLPGALQSVNSKIFREWLPGNPEYEMAMDADIEHYAPDGGGEEPGLETAIWLPVRRK